MKIQITFDKKDTSQAYLKAPDYYMALWEIYHMLRDCVKYQEKPCSEIYETFFDILNDYSININDDPDFEDDVS